jgi:predicted metal-dependent hydrolase
MEKPLEMPASHAHKSVEQTLESAANHGTPVLTRIKRILSRGPNTTKAAHQNAFTAALEERFSQIFVHDNEQTPPRSTKISHEHLRQQGNLS